MRSLLRIFVVLPIAIVVIMLAVANRHTVPLSFNPLDPANSATMIDVPVYWLVFACVALGVVLGGTAVWFRQGYYRRAARDNRYEAAKWRAETDRHRETLEKISDRKTTALPAPRSAA